MLVGEILDVILMGDGKTLPLIQKLQRTVQWPKRITPRTKMVLVTVKFDEKRVWRHSYTVDGRRADITVKTVNLINKTADRISVGVDHVKNAVKSVTAVFKDNDKQDIP